MDQARFEELSRRVGTAPSRRATLRILAAALVAPAAVGGVGLQEATAGIPILGCKVPGKKCDSDQRCCSGRCKKRICLCKKKGQACWNPLEGALCCSGHCDNGKCR